MVMGMVRRAVQRRTCVHGLMSGPGTSPRKARSRLSEPPTHCTPHPTRCPNTCSVWRRPTILSTQSPKGPAQSESTHARMAAAGPLFTPPPSPFTRKRGMSPSRAFLDLEGDALRERQIATPVDGVRLPAHVGLPRIRARLAAAARILFAAECAADLGAGSADVHVGDAAVAARRREERLGVLQPVREDGGRQAMRRRVL